MRKLLQSSVKSSTSFTRVIALALASSVLIAVTGTSAIASPTEVAPNPKASYQKVIKLKNGKTRIQLDLPDRLQGSNVSVRLSTLVDGKFVVSKLGKVNLNKRGRATLTLAQAIREGDTVIARGQGKLLLRSEVKNIEDRTKPETSPAPPSGGGSGGGGNSGGGSGGGGNTPSGTFEVQTIVLTNSTPTVGWRYSLTVGNTFLDTDPLGAATYADLLSKIRSSAGYSAAPFTVALSGNNLELTWKDRGDIQDLAYISKYIETTDVATVTTAGNASTNEVQTIILSNATLEVGARYEILFESFTTTTINLTQATLSQLQTFIGASFDYNQPEFPLQVVHNGTNGLTLTWKAKQTVTSLASIIKTIEETGDTATAVDGTN